MLASAPQFFLEFSLLLGICYLLISRLRLPRAEKASILAGIPILCFLIPGLRIPLGLPGPGMIEWTSASFSWTQADWGMFIRNANLGDILFLIYWIGFAFGFARFMDRLSNAGFTQSNWATKTFFKQLFDPEESPNKASAVATFFGLPRKTSQLQALNRAHFFELCILEAVIIINWWNPILYLYRKKYIAFSTETDLEYFSFESETHKALGRIISLFVAFILLINIQPLIPGAQQYVSFFKEFEEKSRHPFFEDQNLLAPVAMLNWGGHEIPIAAVHQDAALTYEVYYLQPFEFYLLGEHTMNLQVGIAKTEINTLVGQIGLPHSDELSLITSQSDFRQRLPRLVSMGEQTLYLRMEGPDGKTWVAVLAVSETAQVYNQQKGMNALASDVASIEQEITAINTPKTPYRFVWGDLVVPLEKYANPDVYQGYLEISLDSFLAVLEQEMKFFAQDSTLDIEHLTIRAYGDASWRSVLWYPEILTSSASLKDDRTIAELASKIAPGNQITLYGRAGDLFINSVAIQIFDPNKLYRPTNRAPEINHEPAEYDFQLINRPNYPSMVRIDTINPSSQRIVNMYRGKAEYEIIHVPDFQTNERLLNSWESETEFIEKHYDLKLSDLNYSISLPEYHGYHDSLLQIKWGDMNAMNNSQVYDLDEYELNRREGIQLWIGSERFQLKKATIFYAKKGDVRGIYLLDSTDLERPHILPQAQAETSIFIKKIIIQDSLGKDYVLPVIFGFHLGKETSSGDWELQILEDEPGIAEINIGENSYQFRHYKLSELIEELLSVRSNRISFANLKSDPTIQVSFLAEAYRENLAHTIILQALKKKYGFTIKSNRVDDVVTRIQVNYESRLLEQSYEGEVLPDDERFQIFDPEGFHQLRGITLTELTHLLEDRFGKIIEMYPTAYNNLPFNFSLVLDNFPAVKQQLIDDYGLQVFEDDGSYYEVQVRFGN